MQSGALRNNQQELDVINITDNYKIEVPFDFIDCFSLDIIAIPVLATDKKHYEASQIASWLARGKRNSPLLGNFNLEKNISFDRNLYDQMRQFFRRILIKDHNILHQLGNEEALAIITKQAEGIRLGDEPVIELKEYCAEHGITLQKINDLPPANPEIAIRQEIPANNIAPASIAVPIYANFAPAAPVMPMDSTSDIQNLFTACVTWGALCGFLTNGLLFAGEAFMPPIGQAMLLATIVGLKASTIPMKCSLFIDSDIDPFAWCATSALATTLGVLATIALPYAGVAWWASSLIVAGATLAIRLAPIIYDSISNNPFSFWNQQQIAAPLRNEPDLERQYHPMFA